MTFDLANVEVSKIAYERNVQCLYCYEQLFLDILAVILMEKREIVEELYTFD